MENTAWTLVETTLATLPRSPEPQTPDAKAQSPRGLLPRPHTA